MGSNNLMLRQVTVFLSAAIYWAGVAINSYRIQNKIGRSPNLAPGNLKEKLLWTGWVFVISGWIGQPLIMEKYNEMFIFAFMKPLFQPGGIYLGIIMALSGYAGTLWCYASLGDSWRIGINRKEKNVLIRKGPYRFVRHPIYLFQIIILLGVTSLLPTVFSFLILLIHFICVMIKALDEEAYLLGIHGEGYREYLSRTGRFSPRLKS